MKTEIEKLIEKYQNSIDDKSIVYSETKVKTTVRWVLEDVIKDLKNLL